MIAVLDAANIVRYASPSTHNVLGYAPDELEGRPATTFVDPDDLAEAQANFAAHLREPGSVRRIEFRVRHKDGSWRMTETIANNRMHDPAVRGIVLNCRDITDRKQAEEALRASEERHRALTEHATDLVAVVDARGIITYASPSYAHILGYPPNMLEGADALALVHPDDLAIVREGMARRVAEGGVGHAEYRIRHADGSWRVIEVTTNNRLHDPAIRGIIATARDVTDRRADEELLQQQALHDALTGLPNRALLNDRLAHALAVAARERTPLALFLMDLDRFKEVNDTLGHDAGDDLLREVGRRVQGALRASDTVARLGGDEFAMLLPGADAASATETARKVLSALVEPVTLHEQIVYLIEKSGG